MNRLLAIILTFIIGFYTSCTSPSEHSESFTSTRLPSQEISLTDLSAFQEASANWSIVGSVYADRHQEQALAPQSGTGVLVSLPQDGAKNLFTSFEHGDLDLELDFMMPKTSNSGIYLQGRYEVQLLDSWGKDSVGFGDCGGIYQRWSDGQGYEGTAPRTNASYAPGLWQHISIKYQAPRFDAQGKKIRDALFQEVTLNGVLIHENLPVSGPTRSAAFDDEQAMGPLMFQGDHGPIAFRNIRYKRYGAEQITLTDITYKRYNGQFYTADTLQTVEPQQSGATDSISYLFAQQPEGYALVFTGTLMAPTSGDYLMTLRSAGASWLRIDEHEVVNHMQGERVDEPAYGQVSLEQGAHAFELIFSKTGQSWRQGLGWEYEGPEIPVMELQAPGSIPIYEPPPPHIVEVSTRPVVQRGFWWQNDNKRTHTMAVGLPSHVNFIYDLRDGALLSAWGGKFIDATQMWDGRGEDQSITPLGGVLPLATRPSVARLSSSHSAWPDSVDMESAMHRYTGYHLTSTGIPVFEYQWPEAIMEDLIEQQGEERSITRTITVDFKRPEASWYCLVAEGNAITHLPDGSYSVDDRYYVTMPDTQEKPLERQQNGHDQLLVPIVGQNGIAKLAYTIVW